ncbi:MAG: hypothetical protein ACRC3J_05485 [Culicoidibacterales bacterium]
MSKKDFLAQIEQELAEIAAANPRLSGWDTGIWEFHNVRELFMYSYSIRYDFVNALHAHYIKHKDQWAHTEPAAEGVYATQYNTFIKEMQKHILNEPFAAFFNGSEGEMWLANEDVIRISNAFEMKMPPRIIRQPDPVVDIGYGAPIIIDFVVKNVDTYEWESSTNGSTWVSTGIFDTNTVKSRADWPDKGMFYRAKCSGTEIIYSDVTKIEVWGSVSVTKQPVDITAKVYDKVVFEASGNSGTSRWEQRLPGGDWVIVKVEDRATSSYTIDSAGPELNGAEYRYTIYNPINSDVSNIVKLTLNTAARDPVVSIHPKDVEANESEYVFFESFSPNAERTHWEVCVGEGAQWEKVLESDNQTKLKVRTSIRTNNNEYRMVAWNPLGIENSRPAKLKVFIM